MHLDHGGKEIAESQQALNDQVSAVYAELRRLARARLAKNPPGQTLQPTALVHEAYLKLARNTELGSLNRGQFLAVAAGAMREVLVDLSRRKGRVKHGGQHRRVTIDDSVFADSVVAGNVTSGNVTSGSVISGSVIPDGARRGDQDQLDVLELDRAVRQLEETDPRKGQIVNLRYFAGMTLEETASELGVSLSTVKKDWRYIKRWLYLQLVE